jgi:hypothetical protein
MYATTSRNNFSTEKNCSAFSNHGGSHEADQYTTDDGATAARHTALRANEGEASSDRRARAPFALSTAGRLCRPEMTAAYLPPRSSWGSAKCLFPRYSVRKGPRQLRSEDAALRVLVADRRRLGADRQPDGGARHAAARGSQSDDGVQRRQGRQRWRGSASGQDEARARKGADPGGAWPALPRLTVSSGGPSPPLPP